MADNIIVEFIRPEHWWMRTRWKLVEEYVSHNGEVKVPAGFITDGASIPFFARRMFSPTAAYFGAAIVHDYLLVGEKPNWNHANDQFDREMRALHIPSWRRYIIMWAVRGFGTIKTLRNRIFK
jgi:hypothetical protein